MTYDNAIVNRKTNGSIRRNPEPEEKEQKYVEKLFPPHLSASSDQIADEGTTFLVSFDFGLSVQGLVKIPMGLAIF